MNCLFLVLLLWAWYRANSKHHLSFYMFFNYGAFSKNLFFLLGSYPLSTLASLLLHISFTFMSLFLHTSLHYLEAFNHLNFLILSSLVQPRPLSIPKAVWHLVALLLAPSFLLRSPFGLKIFSAYIIFLMHTQFSWSHILLACHSHNSCGISFMFCLT